MCPDCARQSKQESNWIELLPFTEAPSLPGDERQKGRVLQATHPRLDSGSGEGWKREQRSRGRRGEVLPGTPRSYN